MKIPRDIRGENLVKALRIYGYEATRQTGSHIRLTSNYTGKRHNITIPNHNPISVGTLSSILSEVAQYLGKTKEEIVKQLG